MLVKIGRAFGLLLLAGLAWLGVNGLGEFSSAENLWQTVAATTHITYGVAAVVSVFGLLMRQRWAKWTLWICGVAATVTGGLAPVVWGDGRWTIGVLSGIATAAICVVIVWLCYLDAKGDKGLKGVSSDRELLKGQERYLRGN